MDKFSYILHGRWELTPPCLKYFHSHVIRSDPIHVIDLKPGSEHLISHNVSTLMMFSSISNMYDIFRICIQSVDDNAHPQILEFWIKHSKIFKVQ